jgi:hypothetical protein
MSLNQAFAGTDAVDITEALSIIPDRPIDIDQLSRTSHNDPKIMRQALSAFALQSDMLLALIASEPPKTAAARAHTLAVSARVIGAWKVVESAVAFEEVARGSGTVILSSVMNQLSAAVTETQSEIGSILL